MRFTVPYSPEALARYVDLVTPRKGRYPAAIELPEAGPGRWLVRSVDLEPWRGTAGPIAIVVDAIVASPPEPPWQVVSRLSRSWVSLR